MASPLSTTTEYNVATIVGPAFGAPAALAVLVLIFFCCYKRCLRRNNQQQAANLAVHYTAGETEDVRVDNI